MTHPKRIFLVGRAGSGKGLLAKALAKKLGFQFIDANFSLERIVGRPLHEILGKDGETHLHECAHQIISQLKLKNNIVVTTDDSMIAIEKNRKLLSSECVVFLNVDQKTQQERLSHDALPLLPVADQASFLEKLNHTYDRFYEEVATITLNSHPVVGNNPQTSIDADVNEIMKKIG